MAEAAAGEDENLDGAVETWERSMYTVRMAKAPRYTPKQVRALRERLGLTQTQAAEKVGVTLRAWQSWEAGDRVPAQRSVLLLQLLDEGKI